MPFGRPAVLALLLVFPLLETADGAAGGGLLFASLEATSSSFKDPLISLTLHDSGQTTGPLPLNRGSTESTRLSISAQDSRLVLVLATAISSVDSGAGRPVALLSQVRALPSLALLTDPPVKLHEMPPAPTSWSLSFALCAFCLHFAPFRSFLYSFFLAGFNEPDASYRPSRPGSGIDIAPYTGKRRLVTCFLHCGSIA